MPQGSKNGATVFSRIIQQTFQGCSKFISKYQDDIFNHTNTIRELLAAQQETFDRLTEKNMTVAIKKSRLNYPRLKALGHMITERGRCPDIKQIQAILDIYTPECTQDVQHIVGICNFSRDYIPNLAAGIDVLMELIPESVDVTATWRDSIHGRALRRIKALLTSAPFLQLPDPTRPYRIHVDGCLKHRGKGAVLLQQSRLWTPPYNPDPNAIPPEAPWTPVAYRSKKLTKAERKNYSATAVEASAMHDCIMHWASYLENGLEFEVVVDHQALVYLATAPAATDNKHIIQMVARLQR